MTHILIVEDDLAFGTMMQTWLKKKGFETSRATSVGAAARLLTDGTKPDLVLSDLRLPDHDGLFLLGWMRKRGHNAPFIVMTNYAEVQNAVLAILADTVGVTNILHDTRTDSTAQRINIADSVANILNDIQNEEQKQNSRQQENVAARLNRQQRVPPYSTITCPKAEKRNDMT